MLKGIIVALAAIFITSTVCAQVIITNPSERSTMHVTRAPAGMKIDGDLSPKEWGKADVGKFSIDVFKPERPIQQQTYVRTMWDDKYLYLSFECMDDNIRSSFTKHDDFVFWENAAEIFIDPEGQNRHYYEIDFGPAGAMFDSMIPASWMMGGPKNISYDVKGLLYGIKVNGTLNKSDDKDKEWTVETAIPWTEFGGRRVNLPPHDGDLWRINFYRIDRPSKDNTNDRFMAWSKSIGAFHEPRNFGTIVFTDEKPCKKNR